jgi:hypothetical protein
VKQWSGKTDRRGAAAQRCTAIKQILVHADVAEEFVAKFTAKVGSLKLGLPWEAGVDLTPLPEPSKPQYLADLCEVSPTTLPHYSPTTLPHYSPATLPHYSPRK